ncbi:MAG: MMPL family transporter [Thermoplasmata archaeon]|nr:MMPL family transporter [Thermoplasmata archaeon]
MFEKYAQHVQKHPKAIIAVWIVALLIAVPFMMQSDDVLNYDMTTMEGLDSESSTGQDLVDEYFDSSLAVDTVLVIPYSSSSELSDIESKLLDSSAMTDALTAQFGSGVVTYSIMGAFYGDDSSKGVLLVTIDLGDLSAMDEIGNLRTAIAAAVETSGLDIETYVTGSSAITYDTMDGANNDVKKIDPLSILLILILLGLFFYTLVTALVPPIVVGTAYGIVLALMFALGQVMDIFYITKTIVLVSMLGAGCDYSVFIIARYREERNYGNKNKEEALTEAIKWAGESVFTSGLAVIIGFAVMSLCSFAMVSTMAITLAMGIIVAMLAALTLIPAVIAIVGDKIFWPRKMSDYTGQSKVRKGFYGKMVTLSRRYFGWTGKFSTKHAGAIVAVAILITVPLGYVALTSEDSFDMISVMPDSEAKEGVDVMTENTYGGYLMPSYALIELESPVAEISTYTLAGTTMGVLTWTTEGKQYITTLQNSLIGYSMMGGTAGLIEQNDDNIGLVMGPISWESLYELAKETVIETVKAQAMAQGMTEEQAQAYAEAYATPSVVNHAIVGMDAMPDMIATPLEEFFTTYNAWDLEPGGYPITVASLIDYQVNIGAGLVSYSADSPDTTGMYIQLMVVVKDEPMSAESMDSVEKLRSVLADYSESNSWVVGTWVLGTGATLYDISEVVNSEFHWIELGVIVLIYVLLLFVLGSYFTPIRSLATIMMGVLWTLGVLHLVFVEAMGVDVIWIVPIVLFVICLGLGMDYDILVTTRIREGKLKGMSNDEAIQNALSWSGSIITLCGLIMGGTFLTLLLSGSSMLQEIGFALGFAILLDALFIVPYVVPALMHLMGDWSWKGPKFLTKKMMAAQNSDEEASAEAAPADAEASNNS